MNTYNTFYWVIAKNQGRGLNGESFADLGEIFAYADKVVAPFINYDKDFDRVFEKLRIKNKNFIESELVLLYDFLGVLQKNGLNDLIMYHIAYLKEIFWHNLSKITQNTVRFNLCHIICYFEREIGNTESSMIFLKSGVEDILDSLIDDQKIDYYFALGNSSKDINKYDEAFTFYKKAENLAEKIQGIDEIGRLRLLIPVYHQLSIYYSERGEYDNEKSYIDKIEPLLSRFPRTDIYFWYPLIGVANYHKNIGDTFGGIAYLEKVLPLLPPNNRFTYPVEWQIIASYESFLEWLSLHIHNEWAALLALIPAKLSGDKRQIPMLFSALSKLLLYRKQGGELMFFVSEAGKLLRENNNQYLHPNIFANLAFAKYFIGERNEGAKLMNEAVNLVRKSDKNIYSLLSLNSQLALYSCASQNSDVYEIHRVANQEIRKLLNENEYAPSIKKQLGFIVSMSLLKSKPETLLTWYEKLRTSKDAFPDDFEYLNFIVNLQDEHLSNQLSNLQNTADKLRLSEKDYLFIYRMLWDKYFGSDIRSGGKQTAAKTIILGGLCDEGFLALFQSKGLQSYYVLEWVLSKSQNPSIPTRIIAEYFSNPLMLNDYDRNSRNEQMEEHLQQLPMLRALIMKCFFLEKMQLISPKQYEKRVNIANQNLENFYEKWKRTPVITVERAKQEQNRHDTLHSRKTDTSKINSQTTAMDLGIHLDNYLNRSLFSKIVELKKIGTEMPVLLDLIQFDDFACWLILDTNVKDILKDGVSYEKVFISKQEAESLTKKIYDYIERNEINIQSNTFLPEISEIINVLTPLTKHIEKNRIVYAHFAGVWAGIPLENIPFTTNNDTLLDTYQISRRFLRKDDWLYYTERTLKSQNDNFAWIAGNAQNNLPHAKESLDQIGKWLNTKPIMGEELTYEKFVSTIEGHKIIHIENHGKIFRTAERAYWSYLTLSNNDIIGQEIAALDLSEAELVFIAACNSADVKNIGNAHSDTIGSYFALAGAKSVIASITQINDARAKELVSIFYQKILVERLPLSLALRETLSKENRKKYNFHISPLVLMGNNKTIHIQ